MCIRDSPSTVGERREEKSRAHTIRYKLALIPSVLKELSCDRATGLNVAMADSRQEIVGFKYPKRSKTLKVSRKEEMNNSTFVHFPSSKEPSDSLITARVTAGKSNEFNDVLFNAVSFSKVELAS